MKLLSESDRGGEHNKPFTVESSVLSDVYFLFCSPVEQNSYRIAMEILAGVQYCILHQGHQ